jgi:hypothetical protein
VDEDFKFISFAGAFDPETVNILGNAFERAWQKTETSGYRFARPGYAHMMRRVMVKHILNLAECASEMRSNSAMAHSIFSRQTTRCRQPLLAARYLGRTSSRD